MLLKTTFWEGDAYNGLTMTILFYQITSTPMICNDSQISRIWKQFQKYNANIFWPMSWSVGPCVAISYMSVHKYFIAYTYIWNIYILLLHVVHIYGNVHFKFILVWALENTVMFSRCDLRIYPKPLKMLTVIASLKEHHPKWRCYFTTFIYKGKN